ncbi:hypothetical protein HanRHA438_Chr10g0462961 [Helianthus annuus]|nr:hypothetical protein HanRHA438_Chr10g0462961 [Helianthus annuus]
MNFVKKKRTRKSQGYMLPFLELSVGNQKEWRISGLILPSSSCHGEHDQENSKGVVEGSPYIDCSNSPFLINISFHFCNLHLSHLLLTEGATLFLSHYTSFFVN